MAPGEVLWLPNLTLKTQLKQVQVYQISHSPISFFQDIDDWIFYQQRRNGFV